MHDCPATTMPGREQDAAVTAFVFNVLETADKVGDTAKAETDAHECGPCTVYTKNVSLHILLYQIMDLAWGNLGRVGVLTWWCFHCDVLSWSRLAYGNSGNRPGQRNLAGWRGERRFGSLGRGVAGRAWSVVGGLV